MKIACIYWWTPSVGGIATHLNTLRHEAQLLGHQFHILHSKAWKKKRPRLFPQREWVSGGDTRIWVDGEIPQNEEAKKWVEENYDAVVFGFICPHKAAGYPTPEFLPLYDIDRPKVAWVMDGYWDTYSEWAEPLLPKLDGVLCPLESYALPLRKLGVKVTISPFPFKPFLGNNFDKNKTPYLLWPNQWKDIKGITRFLSIVPKLPSNVKIEMYSCGIKYYQLRTEEVWKKAINKDHFLFFHGEGRANYWGNVDRPVIAKEYQKAWFTVNLQGITSRKETYKKGSYNNTEVEALWYNCVPILHSSTSQTDLPTDLYARVKDETELPSIVKFLSKEKLHQDTRRLEKARQFIIDKHWAADRVHDMLDLLLPF